MRNRGSGPEPFSVFISLPRKSLKPFSDACSSRCRFPSKVSGVGVGLASATGERAIGDGLGFSVVAGVAVGEEVGATVTVGEGVPLGGGVWLGLEPDVAVWRRQSQSNRIAARAALSLQKSLKGRSEKQLIAGEAEYV